MTSILDDLKNMGFDVEKCEKAVQMAGNDLEAAVNWIVQDIEASKQTASVAASDAPTQMDSTSGDGGDANATDSATTAASFKCADCGKLSKNMDLAIVHAEKSGHPNIEESTETIKPMTEEEKKAKAEKLQLRLAEKRKEKAELEKQEEIEKEKRRRANAQEIAEAKREREQREMREIAEERRQQKIADAKARQKVLDGIKRDREAAKARRAGETPMDAEAATPPPKPVVNAPKPDYTEAKIQLRLPSGKPVVHTFSANETLAAVRLYAKMQMGTPDVEVVGEEKPMFLKTTFPRKTFNDEDMATPLKELGLVPSAVIIVSHAP